MRWKVKEIACHIFLFRSYVNERRDIFWVVMLLLNHAAFLLRWTIKITKSIWFHGNVIRKLSELNCWMFPDSDSDFSLPKEYARKCSRSFRCRRSSACPVWFPQGAKCHIAATHTHTHSQLWSSQYIRCECEGAGSLVRSDDLWTKFSDYSASKSRSEIGERKSHRMEFKKLSWKFTQAERTFFVSSWWASTLKSIQWRGAEKECGIHKTSTNEQRIFTKNLNVHSLSLNFKHIKLSLKMLCWRCEREREKWVVEKRDEDGKTYWKRRRLKSEGSS